MKRAFFELTTLPTLATILSCLLAAGCSPGEPDDPSPDTERHASEGDADAGETEPDPVTVRVATFNASLFRDAAGQLADDLAGGDDPQARNVAEILQRIRPDIVLLNEFDWDGEGRAAEIFVEAYLSVGQNDASGLEYAHRYVPETNTGVHAGVDLNNDGRAVSTAGRDGYGDDAHGFGAFPGQYGMVIYSAYPIAEEDVRTFRELRWDEMPDNRLPENWYSEAAVDVLRLSSKNHVDLPIRIDGTTLHLLASHPTPPGFDGDADRNGRRNGDEIRFWRDYVSKGGQAGYITDDAGNSGGLAEGHPFVVVGDLNNDPYDGDGRHDAIRSLLEHPRIQDPQPESEGARRASDADGGVNGSHDGDPGLDTADFSDGEVGNLRVDYALPSSQLEVEAADVFWPIDGADHADLLSASDHHPVWVDVELPPDLE